MKKTLIIIFLACMVSCGKRESVKYAENIVLGHFPSVYADFGRKISQAAVQENEKIKKLAEKQSLAGSSGRYNRLEKKKTAVKRKSHKEYVSLTEERTKRARQEFEPIRGNSVPCEFDYIEPRFEILSATVESADFENGDIMVNLQIRARSNMTVNAVNSQRYFLYYVVTNQEQQYIYKGIILPFVSEQSTSNQNLPDSATVFPDDICCEEGSLLPLRCGQFDLERFSKIKFIDPELYATLKQHYR